MARAIKIEIDTLKVCVKFRYILISRQGSLGVFDIAEIGFPQINIEHFHETSLKQFLHSFIVSASNLKNETDA